LSAGDDIDVQVYDAYRRQIEHEDTLISERVGWFIASEAFLFAAYAVVLTAHTGLLFQSAVPVVHRLLTVVPVVGIFMAALVGLGIGAAMHRMRLLQVRYRGPKPKKFPPLRTKGLIAIGGHVAPASITPIVIVSWVVVRWGLVAFWISVVAIVIPSSLLYARHEHVIAEVRRCRSS
jgi:hypothetical protein